MSRFALRCVVAATALAGVLLAGCESPDTSYRTSPSARSLLGGITSGGVLYNIPELPPEPGGSPEGWDFELGNARFEKLQNGVPSLFVVGEFRTEPGADMEIWLSDERETIAKWSGPESAKYNGVVCWQQELEDDGAVLPLGRDTEYWLTVAFRDPENGAIVTARRIPVRNDVPKLEGTPAQTGSDVFKHLLACPKGS